MSYSTTRLLPLLSVLLCLLTTTASADEFDDLRQKWVINLVGDPADPAYDAADPHVIDRLIAITDKAQAQWTPMVKTGGNARAYLWPDLTSTTSSSVVTTNYSRLRTMALAYATAGSTLYGNTSLRDDIIGGLDWVHANKYNPSIQAWGNWWDFQIGAPTNLLDVIALVHADLTTTQLNNYTAATAYYLPNPVSVLPAYTNTGANRVWKTQVVLLRSIFNKNAAGMVTCRDALSPVFDYSWGDGFHLDGSFIQHTNTTTKAGVPYAGGYGKEMLLNLGSVLSLLEGSTWALTDTDLANAYGWIGDSYMPFIYKGGCMSMVRGREIAVENYSDHNTGHTLMASMLKWTRFAPPAEALLYKRMIKYWAQQDTHKDFLAGISNLDLLLIGKEILADPDVLPMEEPVFHQPFPEMDRVVHFRPGFGFGLSLFSSRINGYEFNAKTTGSTSGVNKRAWYTGYGMTYLYNGDLEQFEDSFWATINPYRLPGTTVDTRPLNNAAGANIPGTNEWAGSAEISDLYGVAGFSLKSQFGSLTAKKSWFMFDDEIIALGAGITSTDAYSVETIVENRRLNSTGSNALTVNGTAKSSALGWTETLALPAQSWLHLAGNATTGSPIPSVGYFFPTATSLKGLREQRIRYWTDINTDGSSGTRTRNYLTLWTDHGVNPAASANTYAYALLPNKTTAQLATYAAAPDFTVIANTASVQAVKEHNLNLVAANFWTDTATSAAHITSDRQAAVLTRESADEIEIAVSDPTQLGTTTLLDIGRTALAFISGDPRITVTRLTPTIQLSVDVSSGTPHTDAGNGIRGKTWKARFRLPDGVKADNADVTGVATTGTWTPISTALDSWNGTHLRGASGTGAGTVTFTPKLTAGLHQVYVWWSAENTAANATNVPITITHATGSTTLQLNQRQSAGQWVSLGAYTFAAGTTGAVAISSAGTDGHVLADAVRFVPRTRVVRFDCGDPLLKTNSGYWNNVARATTALITNNALDSTGLGTGMGFNITTAFLGITSTGTTATTAGFPATATQDALYVQNAQEAKIKLQGLNPALRYTVNFYGSGALAGNGSTLYTVGTRTVTLDAAANVANTATLADITPDPDGSFRVGIKNAIGSGHGYLGVVEVVW